MGIVIKMQKGKIVELRFSCSVRCGCYVGGWRVGWSRAGVCAICDVLFIFLVSASKLCKYKHVDTNTGEGEDEEGRFKWEY